MKKNLVLLIPSLLNGGAERAVSRLSNILRDSYNTKVVIFDSSSIDYICSCDIISLKEPPTQKGVIIKSLRALSRILKYRKFKKENSIDITYSFNDSANIVNIFSGGQDKKVTSVRGYGKLISNEIPLNRNILNKLFEHIYKKSDLVVCVSQVIKETLIRRYNVQRRKVKVIYNGYDLEEIKRLTTEKRDRDICNLTANKFTFVSMGCFRPEKGFGFLIETFGRITQDLPDAILLIIGKGTDIERKKINDSIKLWGLENKVFLCGFYSNPYPILAMCDCYILSSFSEGFPNAMVEAMACGLPVIATDCKSGPREILTENQDISHITTDIERADYGILIRPALEIDKDMAQSISALALAMKEMANCPDLREHYSKKSIQRAADFSYTSWKNAHDEAFSEL